MGSYDTPCTSATLKHDFGAGWVSKVPIGVLARHYVCIGDEHLLGTFGCHAGQRSGPAGIGAAARVNFNSA